VGEGGCGVVYVVDQTEAVRRRVALKVIKLGMDTRSVVARFEAERQALALMDHPNIAVGQGAKICPRTVRGPFRFHDGPLARVNAPTWPSTPLPTAAFRPKPRAPPPAPGPAQNCGGENFWPKPARNDALGDERLKPARNKFSA
jgi:hypothetical protein